jgi:hypothetical protein
MVSLGPAEWFRSALAEVASLKTARTSEEYLIVGDLDYIMGADLRTTISPAKRAMRRF